MKRDAKGRSERARSYAGMLRSVAELVADPRTTPRFRAMARQLATEAREQVERNAGRWEAAVDLAAEMKTALPAAHAEALVEDAIDPSSRALAKAEKVGAGVAESEAAVDRVGEDIEVVDSALMELEAALAG